MNKRVDFSQTAASWLLNKDLATEDVIISIVLDFPFSGRVLLDDNCFYIESRRRKKWLIVWVHEYPERLLVYKLHSSDKPMRRPQVKRRRDDRS